ncbi:MAG TPA: helix-turn-helix domain-containing protein [Pyrinomonadaceae bacterium]|nr:helix-turn-helix domain-containing protein [Pyrinomonadaceae bacterium]
MTLGTSLLLNPNLNVGGHAELCLELAREFENKGEYQKAREALSGLWPDIGERPRLTDLQEGVAAEVLMRAGVLTGYIGFNNQIADAQEQAKNLISESLTLFEAQSHCKKIAEAQTELALCYWRTGEFNEARDLLKDALSRLPFDCELKAKAVLRLAIVERRATNLSKALQILTQSAPLFERVNSHTLKGCYYQALGDVLENLWTMEGPTSYLDRALIEYAAASYHFEEAEHRRFQANVENNLGFLYFKVSHCEEAHKHLDCARRIFTNLNDKCAAAQADETRARVFLKEGQEAEAESVARSSVRALEKSDRQSLLAESLTTHGIALARLGYNSEALASFRRAIDLSKQLGSIHRAAEVTLTVFEELGDRLVVIENDQPISGRKFVAERKSLESDLIQHALEVAQGSITHAARNLGMSHQALNYMLHTRHKDLLTKRTPPRRRSRKPQIAS